ncbi:MAG: PAS domain S-box protein [Nitrospirae bacterium]|nr:PAS domain S-box protein [Nitrospirota bacterium]
MPTKSRLNRFFFFPVIIFLLSVIAIAVVGLRYYTDRKAAIKKEKQTELLAIADLKVNQIENWYNGQLSDSHIIMHDSFAVSSIRKWLANENQAKLRQDIFNFLALIKNSGDFYSVSLLDLNGNIRLSSYDEPSLFDDYEKKYVNDALSTRKVIFSDLHMAATSGLIHLDIYVPLMSGQEGINVPVGAVLLQTNPNSNLYPLVQSWPTPSPTAETLLVRREGDQVIYLNELRHRKGTALRLTFPLSSRNLPAAMAARGETGVTEGIDYRGVKVIAALREVHGLHWMMISKVDEAELYAPIQRRLWVVSLIIMAFTVAAGTGIGLFWYKQSTDYYIEQYALEKKFEDVMSSLAEGIMVTNEAGHCTFINAEAERLLGWTSEELAGRVVHDLTHYRSKSGDPLTLEECPIHKVFETGERYFSQKEVFVRKDGNSFPVAVLASPVTEDGKTVATVVSFRDITAEKQLEEELLKAQKLESVGILAGGIAHDYNNLLQGIVGYIGLAKSYAGEGKMKEMLEKAERALNSARELSFRLLTFSKGGEPVMRVIDMSKLIEETASMAICDLHVICDFRMPDDLHPVEGDEGQLYQVIRNISMNSKEAMPNGGKLTYAAENVTIGEDSNIALNKGEYVRVSISDTGTGIAAEHLTKIFDPYFTTKEMGSEKGTGLGLSVCYSIIRKHKGLITVESTKGVGTTFHTYLPAHINK